MRRGYQKSPLRKWLALVWYATLLALCLRWSRGMSAWNFWDWIAYGGVGVAAFVMAIDTAITQSENLRKHLPRLLVGHLGFLPLVLMVGSGGAFAYQQTHPASILDLPDEARTGSPFGVVQAWGADNGNLYMVAKPGRRLLADAGLHRLILIVRVPFIDRDSMTDTNIRKSQAYTILDGFMTLAIPSTAMAGFQMLPGKPTPVNFSLIELPSMFSPDQITTLGDVSKLAGKILDTTQTNIQFTSPPSTNPQAVCPPIPAQPSTPRKS